MHKSRVSPHVSLYSGTINKYLKTSLSPHFINLTLRSYCKRKQIINRFKTQYYEHDVFNISSEHLCPKFKCSPEHRSFHHKTYQNVFEPITSGSPSQTSSKCSSRNICKSKFEHLKNSRFVSTSFIFRKRDALSNENVSSSAPETYSSRSNSPSSYPPTTEEGTSSHIMSKEIKGPDKTLDSLHHKNILWKTSGSSKTFSLSHLGTSTCGKPKVKAAKHIKSSPKTTSSETSSPTCYSRSALRSRCSAFLRLAHGEQPLCFIIIITLIILLLLHLFIVKLMRLPFDRGKETFIFIY